MSTTTIDLAFNGDHTLLDRMEMWDRKAEFAFQDSQEAERSGLRNAASSYADEAHQYSQYASAIEGEFDTRPSDERIER